MIRRSSVAAAPPIVSSSLDRAQSAGLRRRWPVLAEPGTPAPDATISGATDGVGHHLSQGPEISYESALRPSRFFGTSDPFWLNLQSRYALEVEHDRMGDVLAQIEPLAG